MSCELWQGFTHWASVLHIFDTTNEGEQKSHENLDPSFVVMFNIKNN